MVIANPVPKDKEADPEMIKGVINQALKEADE